jgi:hypothetical protein
MGAAAAFFFTIGKRVLAPHDTRLRDADVLYVGAGRSITAFCGSLQGGFSVIYDCATAAADGLVDTGKVAMRMEDRDVNWNIAMFAGTIVAVVAALILWGNV